MNNDLETKIFNKYSRFFEYLKNDTGTYMPIQFGIECGDGWYVLLDSLLESIDNYIKSREKHPRKQIKSHFWRWFFAVTRKKIRHSRWLYKTFYKFEKRLKKQNIAPPSLQITQIKEKFGGLRFYVDGGDDFIDGMIGFAETLSYKTCEYCGTTENIGQTSGWIVTICKKCFDKGLCGCANWSPRD